MKKSDKIKRAIAFYVSVLLFFITLPILLSYSLGYRIEYKAMKVYKTGIIFINTKPSGASVYINDELLDGVTPTQVEDLKPGSYRVKVNKDGFYPWGEELIVRPNMVTKADSIILFPVMQEMNRISGYPAEDFAVSERGYIYYFTGSGLFRSDTGGVGFKKLSSFSDWPKKIIKKRFSPDGDKILLFNEKNIVVVYLAHDKDLMKDAEAARVENILISEEPILDVFWYTGSGYIIAVTEKYINVLELRGGGKRNIATLYKFAAKPQSVSYDPANGTLYFMDRASGDSAKGGAFLYRLDLRQKFFDYLMQLLLKKEPEASYEKR
ncbi:MAG: PEGA domain-containing protein [Candidatus Omnitrophica bacterium]|nr:PEGA domain-containing protein [Candidatus Omnitrophota bacterium]